MSDIDSIGRRRAKAKDVLKATLREAEAAVKDPANADVPEAEIARRLSVDRMMVRKWLGKR
jgi:DNA invertase Pin-like site-specific DNA recombinase